jgi:hypothetical protein
MGSEDAVHHAIDMVGPGARGQTDGEADVAIRQDRSSLAAIPDHPVQPGRTSESRSLDCGTL